MSVTATLIGVVLVFVALRDIFQQLFNPSGGGSLSRMLMGVVWGLFRRIASRRPSWLGIAGPFVFLSVIGTWVTLLAVGWALILLPQMPESLLYQTGLDPSENGGFISALYVSMTTLTTLGYGDIVPTLWWLRVLQPLQALTGFAILTTAVTWLLSIYPAISERRTFAKDVHLIWESEPQTGNVLEKMSPEAATQMLGDLTSGLIAIDGKFDQFPITYYFHENDERASLAGALPYLAWLAERGGDEHHPASVRFRAATLRAAVRDISSNLGSQFLHLSSAPVGKVLEAYARDHFRIPRHEAS